MIVSENPVPSLKEFSDLMSKCDFVLNEKASKNFDYFKKRNGTLLEDDVCETLNDCAKGTDFEGSIIKVSGSSFPDIVAHNFYGVEVKSTEKNVWTSTGSSILESTRIDSVERIFLTFGKLGGNPIEFISRPYEDCLSDIGVTHYPRYKINMQLEKGKTIFDKMGVSYDKLRKMENPVPTVSEYYKSLLKEGESLWWAGTNQETESAPAMIKLWGNLTKDEQEILIIKGYCLFPEIAQKVSSTKYNRFAIWLITKYSIVNPCIRDSFSAGGQVPLKTKEGIEILMPAVFGRIKKYAMQISNYICSIEKSVLKEKWNVEIIEDDRIKQWCSIIAKNSKLKIGYTKTFEILLKIFEDI